MAEDPTPERSSEAGPRRGTETGATAIDITGGVLGLVVFVVGVALVIVTYRQATVWYGEIGPAVEAARLGSPGEGKAAPEVGGKSSGADDGPVIARPGGPSLTSVAIEFGLRLVWLLVLALLGFVVAAMGARLAGAHRGKRT